MRRLKATGLRQRLLAGGIHGTPNGSAHCAITYSDLLANRRRKSRVEDQLARALNMALAPPALWYRLGALQGCHWREW